MLYKRFQFFLLLTLLVYSGKGVAQKQNGFFEIGSKKISFEYEEKIAELHNPQLAETFLDFLSILPNVHQTTVYYRFLLITADADDDKFADCAIAGGIHFLVTDDSHYNVLLKLGFTKVNLLKIKELTELLESLY